MSQSLVNSNLTQTHSFPSLVLEGGPRYERHADITIAEGKEMTKDFAQNCSKLIAQNRILGLETIILSINVGTAKIENEYSSKPDRIECSCNINQSNTTA